MGCFCSPYEKGTRSCKKKSPNRERITQRRTIARPGVICFLGPFHTSKYDVRRMDDSTCVVLKESSLKILGGTRKHGIPGICLI